MRIGAIAELRVGHLSRFSNQLGINSYLIRVYHQSAKEDRYYCFSIPELTEAIDNYLSYRKRFGEEINPDSPLIREQFDIEDSWAAKHLVKPLSRKTYDKLISRFMKKAGVSFPTIVEAGSKRILKRRVVAQTMGFRKRAMTKMIQAKVDYDCREYLIGHKRSRGLNVHYDRTSETERFMEWSKSINLLTGRQINAFQRCRSCNAILGVPVSGFPNSNLPTVTCPRCSIHNSVKLIQNWQCMECRTIFFDDDKFHIKERLDNGLGLKTTGAIH